MPRSGKTMPPTRAETTFDLLEMAERARRLAGMLSWRDDGANRLRQFAGELEARAAQLEPVEINQPTANTTEAE
jgi:hypothetical protein